MIRALTALLGLQLVGEVIARGLHLPVPGPVLGMLLLVGLLLWLGKVPTDLDATARGLLNHLSLLFVPAGTGVIVHLELLQREWVPILITLVVSTYITVLATGGVLRLLRHLMQRRTGEQPNG